MPDQESDPLDVLFVDTRSIDDKKMLAELLQPYIEIVREGGVEIAFTAKGMTLTASKKVLVFLLGRKVVALRKLVDIEAMTPSEIEKASEIPGGTLRPTLRALVESNLLRTDSQGRYFVPSHRLNQVKEYLEKGK